MIEKYSVRTDLALEDKERFESDHVEVQGVVLEEEYDEETEIKTASTRFKFFRIPILRILVIVLLNSLRYVANICRHVCKTV